MKIDWETYMKIRYQELIFFLYAVRTYRRQNQQNLHNYLSQ